MNHYIDLKAKIPANKFYPPKIGANQGIFRKRLVENLLLTELDTFLQADFLLVFDDLHLLHGCEISLELLNYFIVTSPPKIRFILASRHPVELHDKDLKYGNMLLQLDNRSLALDEEEISELYGTIIGLQISRHIVH